MDTGVVDSGSGDGVEWTWSGDEVIREFMEKFDSTSADSDGFFEGSPASSAAYQEEYAQFLHEPSPPSPFFAQVYEEGAQDLMLFMLANEPTYTPVTPPQSPPQAAPLQGLQDLVERIQPSTSAVDGPVYKPLRAHQYPPEEPLHGQVATYPAALWFPAPLSPIEAPSQSQDAPFSPLAPASPIDRPPVLLAVATPALPPQRPGPSPPLETLDQPDGLVGRMFLDVVNIVLCEVAMRLKDRDQVRYPAIA